MEDILFHITFVEMRVTSYIPGDKVKDKVQLLQHVGV